MILLEMAFLQAAVLGIYMIMEKARIGARQRLGLLKLGTLALLVAPLAGLLRPYFQPRSIQLLSAVNALGARATPLLHAIPSTSINWFRVYAAVVALQLLHLLYSWWTLRRNLRRSTPWASDVFICEELVGPMSFGLWRPKVFVPREFLALAPREQEMVLIHERTHISQRDHIWKLASLGMRITLFFSPFAFLLHRRFELDLEMECDRRTLAQSNASVLEYGTLLLQLLPNYGLALAARTSDSSVKRRIIAMKNPTLCRPFLTLMLSALTLTAGVAMAAAQVGVAGHQYRIDAKIKINDHDKAHARLITNEGKIATIEYLSPDYSEGASIFVEVTEHPFRGAPHGLEAKITTQYLVDGQTVQTSAVMDTVPDSESSMWLFGKAGQPWMEMILTLHRE